MNFQFISLHSSDFGNATAQDYRYLPQLAGVVASVVRTEASYILEKEKDSA